MNIPPAATLFQKVCNGCDVYTVEPPNKGHFGNGSFVLSSEVVPISEVHSILIYYIFISSLKCLKWVDNQLARTLNVENS